MRYLLFGLIFLMTTSFTNEDIQMANKDKEFYLYTYYTMYRFQEVPFKRLEFTRHEILFLDGKGNKIPVQHIILKDRKYYVHLQGDIEMPND